MLFLNKFRVFIYGFLGSGKFIILYKVFVNYIKEFFESIGDFIFIFIYVNDVEKVLNKYGKNIIKILVFIINVYEFNGKLLKFEFKDFIVLWNKKLFFNFVIIIDVLDEFIDKSKWEIFFDYLLILMKNSGNKIRWILLCREEEYKVYVNIL